MMPRVPKYNATRTGLRCFRYLWKGNRRSSRKVHALDSPPRVRQLRIRRRADLIMP